MILGSASTHLINGFAGTNFFALDRLRFLPFFGFAGAVR
jgi:hypothetical protein